jgi:hypothetical protein
METAARRRVTAVAFRPQGDYLVASAQGATDSVLRVFNLASGNEEVRFRNDVTRARSIIFDHAGRHLLMGREDGGAELWELNWGEQTQSTKKVAEISGRGRKFIFDPKDSHLPGSGPEGASLGIWRADDLAKEVCSRLGRNLTYGEWQRYSRGLPYARTCDNLPVHRTVIDAAIRLVGIDNAKALDLFKQIKNADPGLGVQLEEEVAWHKAAKDRDRKLIDASDELSLIRTKDNDGANYEVNRRRVNTLLDRSIADYKQALKFYDDKSGYRPVFSPVDKSATGLVFPSRLSNALNTICWWGGLYDRAGEVYDGVDKGKSACAQAALADPYNGGRLDSLALAKALTARSKEEYESAIRGFRRYVTWTSDNGRMERRKCYIDDWEKEGKNPFRDPGMKGELLKDLYKNSSDEDQAKRCMYRESGAAKP